MNPLDAGREALPELPNPLGFSGIEFIEYATPRPQALGEVLELMGFRPVARHRSREVILYRQGAMNLLVNAHPDDARVSASEGGHPALSAVAFRVRDARKAHAQCVERGAWDVPAHAQAMELNIPAIHGPGGCRFYFVDRHEDFSIYDIDFRPIPTVDSSPPALAGLDYFGLVQYINLYRSDEWTAFYREMFGFVPIPDQERFGIMPKGKLLRSPCGQFMWQLVEPDPMMEADSTPESLRRIGLGAPDVHAAVAVLRARGVAFVESEKLHPEDHGALTQTLLGSVTFELVRRSA
ncbi:MAG: 4-hydroxyphenylpyruvate dioxygenase [Polaromonas sp.]|uniref:VOC family protein n=1 Tax=Polaromonas sp. TaxID=1869339 RepID=UPI00273311C5|nr:VOC family protein [Polaromonas sp.]MDP2820062.1 4-hydroxyphenylpyruvate dioxygenase [Polaromonas sp.]